MIFEVCANSVQSAINAQIGGADRIELCQNLNEGGTTPSYATIKYCVENLALKTMVLIRPRPGDFCYTLAEYNVLKNDVLCCKALGVHGIVIGFLNSDKSIDTEKTKEIVNIAFPMEITFHRAFDRCLNWSKSLEQIIECGCTRILTSGQKDTAFEGMKTLSEIVKQANGRIKILAGSGINSKNAIEIIKQTGVEEIHASCKKSINGLSETDSEEVKNIIKNFNFI